MLTEKTWGKLVLLLLLATELWVFSGSFYNFFNHDSIFYLIHAPTSWHEFGLILKAPDAARQYRPLTLGFMGLLRPHMGVNPGPYHWIPLAFHLFNTFLFYCFARRMLSGSVAVIFATAFWGLHSVAGWITYDITCLSDFMLVSLSLLSLILAVDGTLRRSPARLALSVLLFFLCLLTKESAVTLPLALMTALILADLRGSGQPATLSRVMAAARRAIPLTAVFLGMALAYAGLLFHWLRSGMLYAQGSSAAYDIDLLSNILGKAKYFTWALNLPDGLHVRNETLIRSACQAFVGLLLVAFGIDIARRKGKVSPVVWGGMIWFVGTNVPALLLSHRVAKWYLYLPLLGFALAMGALLENVRGWFPRFNQRWVIGGILFVATAPMLFSTILQNRSYLKRSDSAYTSGVLGSFVSVFRDRYPTLPPRITIYMLPSFETDGIKLLSAPPIEHGELLKLYYPGTQVQLLAAYKGERLPEDYYQRPDCRILQYLNGRFYDVTDYYRLRKRNAAVRLATNLDHVRAVVNRNEYYPDYQRFGTPTGAPIFFPTPENDILTQIGGSVATIPVDAIPARACLRFDVSWMYDTGDGAWAEVHLWDGQRDNLLYRKYMDPNPAGRGLSWKEVRLDLRSFADRKADLILKCYNDPGKNTVSDWLNWRDLAIETQ